ncbi:MAG: hypothetical protein ABIG11_06770, partial [bacterium]
SRIPLQLESVSVNLEKLSEYGAYGGKKHPKSADGRAAHAAELPKKERSAATPMIQRISAAAENLAHAHYIRGLVCYGSGDADGARREWNMVLKINPKHAKAKRSLERVISEIKR